MALGDKPKDQTVAPKKAPKLAQLTANSNITAGGNNTAAAGSNNMPQAGRQGEYVLPTPLATTTPDVQRSRAGVVVPPTPSLTPTRGTTPSLSSVPGVKRVGDTFSGTTGSWDKPAIPTPTPQAVPPISTAITPSQQALDKQLSTITPSFGMGGMNKNIPALGDTSSYMTNADGVKTLHAGGGTISSSSPKFGLSTPERLADLDKTLAMDVNPQVIANRAESVRLADQRYNDAYRGGKSQEEYNNPLGSTQLLKQMQVAKANNDIVGYGSAAKTLREVLGNETTRAGQQSVAENARLSNQAELAKLGYTQSKDASTAEALQRNKGIDQSIEIQKAQANIDKNINEQYLDPNNMATTWSPSQSFEFVASQEGNLGAHLGKITGPQTAEEIRKEPDINKRAQRLQSLGLSPDQVKRMLISLQQ